MKEVAERNESKKVMTARENIKSLEELAGLAEKAREEGNKDVLAHGVFDLLHMGHARHLEAARQQGDLLIVTVTADQYVNKGPGRPVFPELLRAEMLAAMDCVGYSGVNHAPTAENVLREVRPDVYVKGGDYADEDEDVTGKIRAEREIVEGYGGTVVYTDELTFSSSELINAHLAMKAPEARAFLDGVRRDGGAEQVLGLIERLSDMKVMFVGETIMDEYHYVTPLGKAAKESIIATNYQSRELFAGGVVAAANHAANFCAEVEVVTCLGAESEHDDVVNDSLQPNIKLTAFRHSKRPTICKRRYVDDSDMRKLFEVCYMDDSPISETHSSEICDYIEKNAGNYDLVIVSDFGHGMLVRSVIDALEKAAKFLAVNAQSNSANRGYNPITKYPRADFVCIDEPEARIALHDKHRDLYDILGQDLPAAIDCKRIIVTHGGRGCLAWEPENGVQHVPAFTNNPLDTIGAGDAFLSLASPMAAMGASMRDVAFVGNIAGGIKVGIVGHRKSVDKVSVKKSIIGLLK